MTDTTDRNDASIVLQKETLHSILRGTVSVTGELPQDATLDSFFSNDEYNEYVLVFSSTEFEDVDSGRMLPEVTYTTEPCESTADGKRSINDPSAVRRVVLSSELATVLFGHGETYVVGLPRDATLQSYYVDDMTNEHTFVFESSAFDSVPEGSVIPVRKVNVFRDLYSTGDPQ